MCAESGIYVAGSHVRSSAFAKGLRLSPPLKASLTSFRPFCARAGRVRQPEWSQPLRLEPPGSCARRGHREDRRATSSAAQLLDRFGASGEAPKGFAWILWLGRGGMTQIGAARSTSCTATLRRLAASRATRSESILHVLATEALVAVAAVVHLMEAQGARGRSRRHLYDCSVYYRRSFSDFFRLRAPTGDAHHGARKSFAHQFSGLKGEEINGTGPLH